MIHKLRYFLPIKLVALMIFITSLQECYQATGLKNRSMHKNWSTKKTCKKSWTEIREWNQKKQSRLLLDLFLTISTDLP